MTNYTVRDECPVTDNRPKHDNIMRKAYPVAEFDNVHDAMDEAYRRSFINVAAGAVDEWDAPEMEAARTATLAAQWDFDGWGAILDQIEMRGYVILGGMAFA